MRALSFVCWGSARIFKRYLRLPHFYNGRDTNHFVKALQNIFHRLVCHFLETLISLRLIHYAEKPFRLFHWRTSHGAEVDLVVEAVDDLWAIEIKSSHRVKLADLRGLKSFMGDHPDAKPICVSTCDTPYMAGEIPVIPWRALFGKDYLDLVS